MPRDARLPAGRAARRRAAPGRPPPLSGGMSADMHGPAEKERNGETGHQGTGRYRAAGVAGVTVSALS
jgi:hypothetical protein